MVSEVRYANKYKVKTSNKLLIMKEMPSQLAERAVQSCKMVLRKCLQNKTDNQITLLLARNIPRTAEHGLLAQRLMSRSTRT